MKNRTNRSTKLTQQNRKRTDDRKVIKRGVRICIVHKCPATFISQLFDLLAASPSIVNDTASAVCDFQSEVEPISPTGVVFSLHSVCRNTTYAQCGGYFLWLQSADKCRTHTTIIWNKFKLNTTYHIHEILERDRFRLRGFRLQGTIVKNVTLVGWYISQELWRL